ncbi:MAG: hypothetical protein ACYCSO_00745 [Cuniculiplasma sp.]
MNEENVREFAEIYHKRWSIENGYQEKAGTKEKTHSPEMGVRYFFFFLSACCTTCEFLLVLSGLDQDMHG